MTFKYFTDRYGYDAYSLIGQYFYDLEIIFTDEYAYTERYGQDRVIMETVSGWTSGKDWRRSHV